MDVALLLILPVLGGYYFSSHWNHTKFRCAREDGHRLYFRAAIAGTFFFIFAYILRLSLLWGTSWYADFETFEVKLLQPLIKNDNAGAQSSSPSVVVITALYALILGIVSPYPLNKLFKLGPALHRAVRDNDIERLIQAAILKQIPLAVTMDNKKVYVGFVVSSPSTESVRKAVALLPLVSGYRSDEGKVQFTTFYSAVYKKLGKDPDGRLSHLTPEHFEIALPLDRINSANLFDFVAYEEFERRARDKKKKRSK